MTIERAIEILDPEHREHYESIEPVNEACRMGMNALKELSELKEKIERGRLVEIPDVTHKFAIVKYPFQKNKPLKVLEYYPCSYNILSKKIGNCYENCDNMNFYVIERDFSTKEAAEARLKEWQEGKK